jgi:hypothetical protein
MIEFGVAANKINRRTSSEMQPASTSFFEFGLATAGATTHRSAKIALNDHQNDFGHLSG